MHRHLPPHLRSRRRVGVRLNSDEHAQAAQVVRQLVVDVGDDVPLRNDDAAGAAQDDVFADDGRRVRERAVDGRVCAADVLNWEASERVDVEL